MKNALFYGLLVLMVIILSLIGYGVYLSVTRSTGVDVASALCTAAVLIGALLAWEFLMKPGYWRRRGPAEEPEEAEPAEPPEGKRSP